MDIRHSVIPLLGLFALAGAASAAECEGWKTRNPEWIFCDDFEAAAPLVGTGRYFEVDDNKGDFKVLDTVGRGRSRGMRALWQAGEVEAGNLKLGFGRTPAAYMDKGIRSAENFREIYYRMYVKSQAGWQGDPYKLSRATVIAKSDWSQAMIAHIWGDRSERLQLDPASCVDGSGNVTCAGYNDFDHLKWIGAQAGATRPFTGDNAGRWVCVEAHVKLNDAGQANGLHEFWIDDKLEARRENLNFVGAYREFGLNGVYFENHWNTGSPKVQERYFDNIVVSTKRITCAEGAAVLPTPVAPPGKPGKGRAPAGSLRRGTDDLRGGIAGMERRDLAGRAVAAGTGGAAYLASRPLPPLTGAAPLSEASGVAAESVGEVGNPAESAGLDGRESDSAGGPSPDATPIPTP